MPPVTAQELPLNTYVVLLGLGLFILILSLIFCCFFISKLRHQARNVRAGYKMVVFKDEAVDEHVVTCAVCLEDFRMSDELGLLACKHAFHKRCLLDWLEIRCSCPMCNIPISGDTAENQPANLLDELM
ncbi:RING finger protein 122 [Danio rerio]|uniref:RING finger protein 122 n=1 Tax=Danio rerio TaxID=7955 RepID=A0A8M6Z901_DANRE|nr:RING finger protein 122-like [Danio rerio]|eukprot:XP_017213655.1 RING finger protein 122-like [Danio rerio]